MKLVTLAVALIVMSSSSLSWASRNEPIQPIKVTPVKNRAMVELGKKLFFDPRLSKSGFHLL